MTESTGRKRAGEGMSKEQGWVKKVERLTLGRYEPFETEARWPEGYLSNCINKPHEPGAYKAVRLVRALNKLLERRDLTVEWLFDDEQTDPPPVKALIPLEHAVPDLAEREAVLNVLLDVLAETARRVAAAPRPAQPSPDKPGRRSSPKRPDRK